MVVDALTLTFTSFGVTICELFTGEEVWPDDLFRSRRSVDPITFIKLRMQEKNYPNTFENITNSNTRELVKACMNANYQERPRDMTLLAEIKKELVP